MANPFLEALHGVGQTLWPQVMQAQERIDQAPELAEIAAGPGHARVAELRRQFEAQQRMLADAQGAWVSILNQEMGGPEGTPTPEITQRALRRFVTTPQAIGMGQALVPFVNAIRSGQPQAPERLVVPRNSRVVDPATGEVIVDTAAPQPAPELDPMALMGLTEAQQRDVRLSFQHGNQHQTAQLIARLRRENSQALAGIDSSTRMGDTLLGVGSQQGEIDRALNLLGGAGFGAALQAHIPGTQAFQLQRSLATIRANLGFAQLLDIKRSGAGLGALDRAELEALQTTLGNLDVSQSPATLRENLERIQRIWRSAREGLQQARASFEYQDVSRIPAERLTAEIASIARLPAEQLQANSLPELERLAATLIPASGGAATAQGRRVLEWLRREKARIDRGG